MNCKNTRITFTGLYRILSLGYRSGWGEAGGENLAIEIIFAASYHVGMFVPLLSLYLR